MNELGFFMDMNGDVYYFGEWKEQFDKKNRHQVHDFAFTDEIEYTEWFKSLYLVYNPDMGLFGKAINFSLQGMIILLNLSDRNTTKMHMFVPVLMTEKQKEQIINLYETLCAFNEISIVMPKSEFIKTDDYIHDLETFLELYNIKISRKKSI